ncbi:MAG: winged helix-turn-helix transcriptional regulator [Acidobacteria bacterium]|nr:winged helix-turn-helix transcriptional regulator [Acidobacteriota bacterium]MBK8811687.1 winged helix-turn-helix transcriptional regulator [Acidobacteriota bacterium]
MFFGLFLDFFRIRLDFPFFIGLFQNCDISKRSEISFISGNFQRKTMLYRFGSFRLDSSDRRFWRPENPVTLKPKQFDLLLYLVENAGRVTTKNELLDRIVWLFS